MNTIMNLAQQIIQICPIAGISSDGDIQFLPEATPAQRAQAQRLMTTWLALPEEQRRSLPGMGEVGIDRLWARLNALESEVAQLRRA